MCDLCCVHGIPLTRPCGWCSNDYDPDHTANEWLPDGEPHWPCPHGTLGPKAPRYSTPGGLHLTIRVDTDNLGFMESKNNTGGGRAPWGYQFTHGADGRSLEPTAEGLRWVFLIFTRIAEGHPTVKVAQWLDDEGVPTATRAGKWSTVSLGDMIRNPAYSGTYDHSALGALSIESLVPQELQDKAQAVMASRAHWAGPRGPRPYLAGRLFCGHPDCPGKGSWPMYRTISRGIYPYYRCYGKNAQLSQRRGCGAQMIPMDELDGLVFEAKASGPVVAWMQGAQTHLRFPG